LRDSRDYQALRNALLAGGVAMSALDTLVNTNPSDPRKDSVTADTQRYDQNEYEYGQKPAAAANLTQRERVAPSHPPSGRVVSNGNGRPQDTSSWRRVSDFASVPDDAGYDVDGENDLDGCAAPSAPLGNLHNGQPNRTLFFLGLSERTTFADFVTIVKGGKVANMVMRGDCALVTFLSGAPEFLAWSKRNDIYLQGKRVSFCNYS
jgi:hypothetical protein